MSDVSLIWNPETFSADISVTGGDLSGGDDLESAVINSLFTWRRAKPDDDVSDDVTRRGWWGDTLAEVDGDKVGSRLWLLFRRKITNETMALAREAVAEALQWLIDEKVATGIATSVTRNGQDRVDMVVTITRTDGRDRELKFDNVWGAING